MKESKIVHHHSEQLWEPKGPDRFIHIWDAIQPIQNQDLSKCGEIGMGQGQDDIMGKGLWNEVKEEAWP